jgi:hypothetical protein
MEQLVRVSDTKTRAGGGRTFLDLADLLPVLEPEAHGWMWGIQRLPDTSLVAGSEYDSLADLESRIRGGPRGLLLDQEGMYHFDRQVGQVVWGEFLAAESPAALPRPDDPDERVGEHALAGLFAFDSSFWHVGGPAAVIERVAARFERVEHVDPRRWVRAER